MNELVLVLPLESTTRERRRERQTELDGRGQRKRAFSDDDRGRRRLLSLAIDALFRVSRVASIPGALPSRSVCFLSGTVEYSSSVVDGRRLSRRRLPAEAMSFHTTGAATTTISRQSKVVALALSPRRPCSSVPCYSSFFRSQSEELCRLSRHRVSLESTKYQPRPGCRVSCLSSTARVAAAAAARLPFLLTSFSFSFSFFHHFQPNNRTQACKFSGLKIYPGRGIHFIKTDSQVRFRGDGFFDRRRREREASKQVFASLCLPFSALRAGRRFAFRSSQEVLETL